MSHLVRLLWWPLSKNKEWFSFVVYLSLLLKMWKLEVMLAMINMLIERFSFFLNLFFLLFDLIWKLVFICPYLGIFNFSHLSGSLPSPVKVFVAITLSLLFCPCLYLKRAVSTLFSFCHFLVTLLASSSTNMHTVLVIAIPSCWVWWKLIFKI